MNKKIIPLIIIIFAIVALVFMLKVSKKSPKMKPAIGAPFVTYKLVAPQTLNAEILSTATIEANQSLNITPEVVGKVIWISSKLIAGGVVKKGDALVKIDQRDYKIAVEQRVAGVEKAKLDLEQENARGEVAKEEWSLLGDSTEGSNLVLRVSHKKVAELNLASVKSLLKKAQLDLSRTVIRAPFTAYVTQKNVAIGEYISQQKSVARLIEKGNLVAEVFLPTDKLKWVNIPKISGVTKGSTVDIYRISNSDSIVAYGNVTALVGEIDKSTRRAKLRIEITKDSISSIPLLPGSFVSVKIKGAKSDLSIKIPRESIINGRSYFTIDEDNTIQQVNFTQLWGTKDFVVSKSEFSNPIKILTTIPEGSVSGMKVKLAGDKNQSSKKTKKNGNK